MILRFSSVAVRRRRQDYCAASQHCFDVEYHGDDDDGDTLTLTPPQLIWVKVKIISYPKSNLPVAH